MTPPKTPRKPRVPRPGKTKALMPKPAADMVPRNPFTGFGAVDGLIWRARQPGALPVFWNRGELDAAEAERRRAEEAGCAATTASFDLNYWRALPDWGSRDGEAGPWKWYRQNTVSTEVAHDDERAAFTEPHPSEPLPAGEWAIPVPPGLPADPVLDANLDARMGKLRAAWKEGDL